MVEVCCQMKYHNGRLISTALLLKITLVTPDNDNDLFKIVLPCYLKDPHAVHRSTHKDKKGTPKNSKLFDFINKG